ncbi:ATPase domain-containing protein [Mucilaginibacter sp. L196]|uniref:RAD55 family ATPase n=1 Tax=Mucilaginibacter sp. L196 TaxID=1641870 RepID=UPI00131A654A|nr:ATPase domain-containing protein [Mucilaginibacter sp. L196]
MVKPEFKMKGIYHYMFPILWDCISQALELCISYSSPEKRDLLVETNPELIKCFADVLKITPKADKHIVEGLYESHQDRQKQYPRVLKLTLRAFDDAQQIGSRKDKYLIPSPLYIIYQLLTVPDNSFTAAYSITACKSFLYYILNIHPQRHKSESNNPESRLFTESQVMDALADFEGFDIQSGRWPKEFLNVEMDYSGSVKMPIIKSFVGHFLAAKGIAHLWFPDKDKALEFLTKDKANTFIDSLRKKIARVKFRKSAHYRELPEWGEVINQIFGFPIPIKGAEVVFFGGLKPASDGGLVISVSGRAGVGKTSFALALANSFSPFGTSCFYISLEENVDDIEKRILTIKPQVEKELNFFNGKMNWFFGIDFPGRVAIDALSAEINAIADDLHTKKNKSIKDEKVIACPYIFVIDNINESVIDFDNNYYQQIEYFIETCRKLNSIILILTPESIPEKLKIEYLVDIGIELKHKGVDIDDDKPIRIFNLFKTRHQLSRQGAHIFHMTGKEGFRISPQIPSQIDRKERIQQNLHDETKSIHTLNFLYEKEHDKITSTAEKLDIKRNAVKSSKKIDADEGMFLNLYSRSNILIHGFGSAGKAGFAMSLLLSPPVESTIEINTIQNLSFGHLKFRRNILIISFLYPEQYYRELAFEKKNIQSRIKQLYKDIPDPLIEYIVLYPGYLSPQDFLNKVTRKLDEAILRGQPFTGVLVDGLHNVFLQFEKLQESNMVWPMLYNILSRYELMVVSTFTNFSLNDKLLEIDSYKVNDANHSSSDHLLLQKGMAPFLHALVKGSDYYFFMEQHISEADGSKRYLIAVKGAINKVPTELLEWDRQKNTLRDVYPLSSLKQGTISK